MYNQSMAEMGKVSSHHVRIVQCTVYTTNRIHVIDLANSFDGEFSLRNSYRLFFY